MKKENNEYYSRENNEYCTIDKERCADQVNIFDTYEKTFDPKSTTVQASTALKYFSYNIFISVSFFFFFFFFFFVFFFIFFFFFFFFLYVCLFNFPYIYIYYLSILY